MMSRSFILIGLMIFSTINITKAQKGFCDGYIITHEKDTLRGKIKDDLMFSKVRLMDSHGNDKDFKASEIFGYSKSGVVKYLSIEGLFSSCFGKIIEDGYIVLVELKSTHTNTTMENTEVSSTSFTYYLYNRKTEVMTVVYQFGFKGHMAEYFGDYPELKQMILNKELQYKELQIIVNKYNTWKNKK